MKNQTVISKPIGIILLLTILLSATFVSKQSNYGNTDSTSSFKNYEKILDSTNSNVVNNGKPKNKPQLKDISTDKLISIYHEYDRELTIIIKKRRIVKKELRRRGYKIRKVKKVSYNYKFYKSKKKKSKSKKIKSKNK